MATLLVHTGSGPHWLAVSGAQSVREVLETTDLQVSAVCGGVGACGACVVRVVGGGVNPPTPSEKLKLTFDERAQGLRLACQLRIEGDAEIELAQPAPPSRWLSIPPEELAPIAAVSSGLESPAYGVAVDLGTTRIRVALWDLRGGKRIATRWGSNPQVPWGADVLNRLSAARAQPHRGREMAELARGAILQAIRDILARELGDAGVRLEDLSRLAVVGNTAMLALLTGEGGDALLDPANWMSPINVSPRDPSAWRAAWFMPKAEFRLPPPLAGFVGSDLQAAVIATRLMEGAAGSLLLDVGTNTEIALWDGAALHVSSVPGGPAFEGAGLRFGMGAAPGAIARVRPGPDGAVFACETLGDFPAQGLCGSGLVDAVAVLLQAGILKTSGRFSEATGPAGHHLDPALLRSAVTPGDVDLFQRAKAATASAMETLLEFAGMGWGDIRRLCVCGSFGGSLDIGHAQAVGLLPQIAAERIEKHACAALEGCERALQISEAGSIFSEVAVNAKIVNFSGIPGWEDRYMTHLRLAPIPLESSPKGLP